MNEQWRRKVLFWALWVLANTVGLSFAWVIAEGLGQAAYQQWNWRIGVLVAGVVFEIILWAARGLVIRLVPELIRLRPIETLIWILGEALGWLIGEAASLSGGPVWLTAGSIWGVMLGAALWLTIWFMLQPRPKGRWWFATVPLWTFIGLAVAVLLMTLALTTSLTLNEVVGRAISPLVGWGLAGAFMGGCVGSITGLVYLRQMRWSKSVLV